MSVSAIAGAVVVLGVQAFYITSEIRMTRRTIRGRDNSADQGTRRLVWILTATAFDVAWVPVIFGFGQMVKFGGWLTWIGVAIMIVGIAYRLNAIKVLGEFFTATVQIQGEHQLIETGPYRRIRHPSYLGLLILALGDGVALANWIALALCATLPLIALMRRIHIEEDALREHFGPVYEEYRDRTWRLVPYLY
jgi:protein-S-isoprenylcysteine O-methyltransferase